jgi:hypothetical protein
MGIGAARGVERGDFYAVVFLLLVIGLWNWRWIWDHVAEHRWRY